MKKAVIAVVAIVVVVLAGLGIWAVVGGDDEASARGTCGGVTYQLSRESDDDGLEVAFELQSATAGEVWDISLMQGDTAILTGERTTDEDAEIDFDAPAVESAGTAFTVTATPVAGGETCTVELDD